MFLRQQNRTKISNEECDPINSKAINLDYINTITKFDFYIQKVIFNIRYIFRNMYYIFSNPRFLSQTMERSDSNIELK